MPAVGLYVFRVRTATGVAAVEAGESVESGFGVEEGFFCAEGRCEGKPYFVVMRVWAVCQSWSLEVWLLVGSSEGSIGMR